MKTETVQTTRFPALNEAMAVMVRLMDGLREDYRAQALARLTEACWWIQAGLWEVRGQKATPAPDPTPRSSKKRWENRELKILRWRVSEMHAHGFVSLPTMAFWEETAASINRARRRGRTAVACKRKAVDLGLVG